MHASHSADAETQNNQRWEEGDEKVTRKATTIPVTHSLLASHTRKEQLNPASPSDSHKKPSCPGSLSCLFASDSPE